MDKSLNRIKEVFEEQGIKQTWLAKRVGKKNCCVVNSYICYTTANKRCCEIARTLQVYPKDLIDSDETK